MNLKHYPGLNPENVKPECNRLQDIPEKSELKPDLAPCTLCGRQMFKF